MRKLEIPREIHIQPGHAGLGEALLQAGHRAAQKLRRDIDRDIHVRPQRRQQFGRLRAITGAEVDEHAALPDPARHRRQMRLENAGLGARQVIFIEQADRLEQGRADGVVKEFWGDGGVLGGEPGGEFGPQMVLRAAGLGHLGGLVRHGVILWRSTPSSGSAGAVQGAFSMAATVCR